MDQFDEYQKLMRYKYGYHSFFIIVVLSIINLNLELFFDIQWAETKTLEFMLFIFIAIGYSIAMNTYTGSYFVKNQDPKRFSAVFLLLGIATIIINTSPHFPLISDGLLTSNSIMVASGLMWTTIPLAYFARVIVDKRRETEDTYDE